jgi:2-polyprenyl-3-methyl-5-hydroxy-6-metoxy-1,4-benzoquinol methylase
MANFEEQITQTGYVQAVPRPTRKELQEFYRDKYFQDPSGSYQIEYSIEELEYFKISAELANFCITDIFQTPVKTLLDLGCGEGFFASHMSRLGWQVSCFDYSDAGISRFNSHLLPNFTAGSIEDALSELNSGENKDFAVINLANVLEHVIEPEDVLEQIRRKLAQQTFGLVRIVVPNDYSAFQNLLLELGIARKTWFCPPEHLNYFNHTTLTALLESVGFEVVQTLADFPIEWFIANSNSNYHLNPEKGKGAHQARVLITRFLASQGMPKFAEFCRATASLDIGRDLITYAMPRGFNSR